MLPAHGNQAKPAGLVTIGRPFFSFDSYIHPSSLQMLETLKDHTRSLVPYQHILEACEAEYHAAPHAGRETVINKIMEQISAAATKGKAKVADDTVGIGIFSKLENAWNMSQLGQIFPH